MAQNVGGDSSAGNDGLSDTNSGTDQSGYENPAAKALKRKNPFENWDGTTKVAEGDGYNPNDNPNKGQINIIDGEEFEVPANQKILRPDPENPQEIIEIDNTSRGKIGFVSNPEKIAELKAQGIPINDNEPSVPTVEDLQRKFEESKADKARQIRIREQNAIKMRLMIQGAPYTPPEDLKDVPGLAASNPDYQAIEPQANQDLGEVILTDEEGYEGRAFNVTDQNKNKPQAQNQQPTIETVDGSSDDGNGNNNQGTGLENQQANVRANQNEGMGASSTGIQGDAGEDKEGKQTLTNPDINPQTGLPNPPKKKANTNT